MMRSVFNTGSYLSTKSLQLEQLYRRQRLWRHNRYLHDQGVVCGLQVVPTGDRSIPWGLLVCPGYAVDCCGSEIKVPDQAILNIQEYLWAKPAEQLEFAYVAIRFSEEPVQPHPIPSATCGCEETTYAASRIRDSFQLDVLWEDSDSGQGEIPDLCERPVMPCPDCTDRTHVILARVTLPASEGDPITTAHIDNQWYQRK